MSPSSYLYCFHAPAQQLVALQTDCFATRELGVAWGWRWWRGGDEGVLAGRWPQIWSCAAELRRVAPSGQPMCAHVAGPVAVNASRSRGPPRPFSGSKLTRGMRRLCSGDPRGDHSPFHGLARVHGVLPHPALVASGRGHPHTNLTRTRSTLHTHPPTHPRAHTHTRDCACTHLM